MIVSAPTVALAPLESIVAGFTVDSVTPSLAPEDSFYRPALQISYAVYDIWPPSLSNQLPGVSAIDVAVDSTIQVSMRDDGNGIDLTLSNLQISYDGLGNDDYNPWITMWDYAGGFASGYDGPSSVLTGIPTLYTFVVDPTTNFDYGVRIYIRGNLEDLSGNAATVTYYFDTLADVALPIVTPVSPTASETGVVAASTISLTVADATSGVDITTGYVHIEKTGGADIGDMWTGAGGFQTGYDGPSSSVMGTAASYTIVIDPTTDFEYGQSYTISYSFFDAALNEVTGSYQFETSLAVHVLSASSVTPTKVRVIFSEDMKAGDLTSTDGALNPHSYSIAGGFRAIKALSVSAFSASEYDLTVEEMTDGASYVCQVSSALISLSGATSISDALITDPNADKASFTGFGEHPRVVAVTNPSAGVIQVDFSEPMNQDIRLSSPGSYTIAPAGPHPPVVIDSVGISRANPSRVTILFRGGGSPYSMTVSGPIDTAGNSVQAPTNTTLFNITKPKIDELYSGDQVFFDTDVGAIQVGYTELSERRVEDLVILRAQSVGFEQQFKAISETLKYAGVSRDETKLKLFEPGED